MWGQFKVYKFTTHYSPLGIEHFKCIYTKAATLCSSLKPIILIQLWCTNYVKVQWAWCNKLSWLSWKNELNCTMGVFGQYRIITAYYVPNT